MGDFGPARHPFGFAAGQLHHMRQRAGLAQLARHVLVAHRQRIAGDHLRHHHAGAEALSQLAEWAIGNSGHGRQKSIIANRMVPDAQLAGSLRHKLPQKWSFSNECLHNSQNRWQRNTLNAACHGAAALHLPHAMAAARPR